MNIRNPLRRLSRRRPRRAPRRAAVSLLAFAALVVSVLVAGMGATAPKAAAATCGTTNVALNKTATASSTENAGTPAADAVDGSTGDPLVVARSPTRSGSRSTSARPRASAGSSLNWEAAYATAFQIQTSTDGTNWTTIYSTTTGTGGVQNLTVTGTGRYIRMYGTARATQYGYSLWEFQVYDHRRRQHLRHHQRGAEQDRHRLLDRERGHPGRRRGRRQHRHPLVERVLRPAVAGGRPRLVDRASAGSR